MFSKAIVRPPSLNFAAGLTNANLGEPVYETALAQHRAYCEALERCGLTLTRLDPDPAYPDATFVEDSAVLTESCAIITRPGAPSRTGEIISVAEAVSNFYDQVAFIQAPGTVDGGDVCRIGRRLLIGISERTNEAGAKTTGPVPGHHRVRFALY
jgi:dimethylargininase